ILRFFYAAGEVKSTDGAGMMAVRLSLRLPKPIVLMVALVACFGLGAAVGKAETPLVILDDSLPTMSAGEQFNFTFHAAGGARPYHWSVEGKLPDGLSMSHEGVLSGRPAKSGPLTITVVLTDSSRPAHPVQKSFQTAIVGSLVLEWLDPPKVHDGRIDGAVQVSNGSKDVFDLTVIVVAVAGNGRATALGYEHFPLKAGTTNFPITFGNTLPNGAYVIHADAVAEITARKNILRQRLQTPEALQVTVGP
ncbi:MAG: putative Ig domain-containing protein, partial [Terriglobales bacterium]